MSSALNSFAVTVTSDGRPVIAGLLAETGAFESVGMTPMLMAPSMPPLVTTAPPPAPPFAEPMPLAARLALPPFAYVASACEKALEPISAVLERIALSSGSTGPTAWSPALEMTVSVPLLGNTMWIGAPMVASTLST